jgi:large subunit ribosomal protein L21
MYAVIRTGGKQYKVAKNDVITIERLAADKDGLVKFGDVLMLGDGSKTTIGTPTVAGASVAGAYLSDTRGEKVLIFKKKRRHNYRRKNGHRQDLALVQIVDILTDGKNADQKAITDAIEAHRANQAKLESMKPGKKSAAKKAPTGDDDEADAKPAKKIAAKKKTATKAKAPAKKAAAKKPAAKKK